MAVHIGTYDESGGLGLVPLEVGEGGSLRAGEPYGAARNASFAACRGDLVYLVDEQAEGAIGVHRRTGETWRPLARVPTGGAAPCYVALDPAGTRLAVANYESGSAALYALDDEGLPAGPPALFQNTGSGPNAERQAGPHAHCTRFSPDGQALYLVDLGADQVLRFDLAESGFGEASVAWTAPAGSGPRHLLFHPSRPLAFLLCELAATLTLLRVEPHGLTALQTLPTAPESFAGENLGGHLALGAEGGRIYVSNRGHDSLAVFALEEATLTLVQRVASGGEHPRHFAFAGERLVVANEKDGRVTAFGVAPDGTLGMTGKGLAIPGACYVLS